MHYQMSWTVLKISNLDFDLQGQINLQTFQIFVLTFKNGIISNFTFQLELFINHLDSKCLR